MRKPMYFIVLLLSIALIVSGCNNGFEPTDDGYTDEEIWARCVDVVEVYFHSDSIHISEDSVLSLGGDELRVESTVWCCGDNYYAEYIQNEDYRFSRFQVDGKLYAKYTDGEWFAADTDTTESFAYRNVDLDETETTGISWEITEDEIRVTQRVSKAQAGEEGLTSNTTTYIFNLEWDLIRIDTIHEQPSKDAMGETVTSEVRRTIICHDTDEATIGQVIDDVRSRVISDN